MKTNVNRWGAGWLALALGGGLAAAADPWQLPPPETGGGKPLMQTLKERRSVREIGARPLPAQHLANLLWAGFGVNRPDSAHRTAPSAMNSQEVDIYVATADGVFLYEPASGRLQRRVEQDLRPLTGSQDFVKSAPVALVFVADLSRLSKAPAADRERYAWMDCGFISQNIYLYCASAGLATVIHELNRAPLAKALGLKQDQAIVLAQSVGFPRTEAGASDRP